MIDIFKLSGYILFFIPGFILIQILEHYLMKEKKSQFEKTLQIALASAFLWALALLFPIWWPFGGERSEILCTLQTLTQSNINLNNISEKLLKQWKPFLKFFLSVCLWSFIIGNLWGYFRRKIFINRIMVFFTGRDWYSRVHFYFFDKWINETIVITTNDNFKYIGILSVIPDTVEEDFIILSNPSVINKDNKFEKLSSKQIMIKIEDINSFEGIPKDMLKIKKGVKDVQKRKK